MDDPGDSSGAGRHMKVLVVGLGLFLTSFLVHLAWWRVSSPARGITSLLKLFLGAIVVASAAMAVPAIRSAAGMSLPMAIHAFLLHLSLSLAYTVLFSALDEDSPSASIVKFVALGGDGGRDPAELEGLITDEVIVTSRLTSMVASGAVLTDGDRYRLSLQGRFWAALFGLLRRVFSLPEMG